MTASQHLSSAVGFANGLTRSEEYFTRRRAEEILKAVEYARFHLHQSMVAASMAFLEGDIKKAEDIISTVKADLATGLL